MNPTLNTPQSGGYEFKRAVLFLLVALALVVSVFFLFKRRDIQQSSYAEPILPVTTPVNYLKSVETESVSVSEMNSRAEFFQKRGIKSAKKVETKSLPPTQIVKKQ